MRQLLIKGLEKALRLLAKDPETLCRVGISVVHIPVFSLGGKGPRKITKEELNALPYKIRRAWVKEWTSALQLGCPYCDAIQINSTALDIMHDPKDYYLCEKCSKIMAVKQKVAD